VKWIVYTTVQMVFSKDLLNIACEQECNTTFKNLEYKIPSLAARFATPSPFGSTFF
jgi:hypothetical protein